MGIFDKVFGSKESKSEEATNKVNWTPLTAVSQLDEAIELSKTKTVVLFKHSTRCSISSSVINRFEKQLGETHAPYYLDLLNHRDISSAIAEKFQIMHQSPQAVVLEGGKVKAHASHYDILEVL